MLATCAQLAAGLGATQRSGENTNDDNATQVSSDTAVSGNAPLGMWVGQQFIGK